MLFLLGFISEISSVLLTALLLAVGIYLSVKTNFFQFKGFLLSIKSVKRAVINRDRKSLSAMLLALGGTVGVGNIAGVGAAIALGGAGSIFWIWICGLIGMITKYAEVYLAVKYKPLGPYGYINDTFNAYGSIVKIVFCTSCVLSSVLIGSVIQSKAVIDTFTLAFNFDYTVSAAFIGVPVFILAFSKGEFIKRTSSVAVPFVSVLYIFMTSFVIIKKIDAIPSVFMEIISSAFNPKSTVSGIFGFLFSGTVRQGISKGLFSHEAGQGSSPIAYSADESAKPKESALFGILEVFVDTGVISTLTAFAMLTSGFWGENGMISAANMYIYHLGGVGGVLFAVSIYIFCIAAICGWIYYAKRSIEIISDSKILSVIYSITTVLIIPFVALFPINILWQLSDIFMLLMTLPNLISILNFKKIIIDSIRK